MKISMTMYAVDPRRLARFWALALGYVEAAPPTGWDTWEAWFVDQGVPRAEWDAAILAL